MISKQIDFQFNLDDSEDKFIDSTFYEYLEITIQYGFIVLFGSAMPLLPMISYINNVFEIFIDREKLMKFTKRPVPKNTADIGRWFFVMNIVSYLAIFFSTGVLIFTTNNFFYLSTFWKVVMFTVMTLSFLALKLIIESLISDEGETTKQIRKRHEYIVEKITKNYSAKLEDFELVGVEVNAKVHGMHD